MDWRIVLGLAAIGVLWVASEPGIRLKDWVLGRHQGVFRRLLECAMCSTFWIAILYNLIWLDTLDLFTSSCSAVLAELVYQKLNNNI